MPTTLRCACIQGPGGPLAVVYGDAGVTDVIADVTTVAEASARLGRALVEGPAPQGVTAALVSGDSRGVRFDLGRLTAFQRQVLEETTRIAPGQVMSYSELAARVGHPGAARAVGSVMRANPIPVLIPCHRVVRNDGSIGNYSGGGPERKRRLLSLEAEMVRVA